MRNCQPTKKQKECFSHMTNYQRTFLPTLNTGNDIQEDEVPESYTSLSQEHGYKHLRMFPTCFRSDLSSQ